MPISRANALDLAAPRARFITSARIGHKRAIGGVKNPRRITRAPATSG